MPARGVWTVNHTLGENGIVGLFRATLENSVIESQNSYRTLPMINDEEDSSLECKY